MGGRWVDDGGTMGGRWVDDGWTMGGRWVDDGWYLHLYVFIFVKMSF
jgi:hypothetical protein